ncbi:hypothetical protein [Jeotgalibacillus aurantiacus]|uniref:hypothetical protein n=1 Tax=Jeotgalibacillus aurantiacus TaxID=2763266 RepID=UPI001D0BBED5|nr:hypothetical protein [Jeotgalibacillus aurantiacus]
MQKLILKISAIVTVCVLLFLPINHFVGISYDYNINRSIIAFKKDPHPVDIINLGASHAMYGYNFKSTGLEHLDLALPAQTIEYDYKLLKEYGEYVKPNGVILVSISQITFGSTENNYIGNYYKILDRTDIDPFNWIDYYTYLYLPGANTGRFLSAVAGRLKQFRWDDHQPWANGGDNYSMRKFQKVENEYQVAVDNNTIRENMAYLKAIIDHCNDNGYPVVLTMEPVHQSYAAYFDENVMNELVFQHLDELDLDVPMLNYMNDKRFSDHQEYFIDPDHLNKEGRKVYSEIVYKDLREMGYLQ